MVVMSSAVEVPQMLIIFMAIVTIYVMEKIGVEFVSHHLYLFMSDRTYKSVRHYASDVERTK